MSSFFDSLKRIRIIRTLVYAVVGVVSYPGLVWINRLKIFGTENIKDLPRRNVLFVSNHQTYFADVITFLHIFCAVKWGKRNKLGIPYYLLNPFTSVYYVAAEETTRALQNNWVITFPQGTTKPFAPGRKGTAFIIKQTRPVVVPVVISGFWRAFNKKGLKFKKKGSLLSITFKKPLEVDYDAPAQAILAQVMDAIEQSKSHMMMGPHHWETMDK
jgi:1-acyl-sn-glycerol-3-phosphate acyltransferase